MTLATIRWIVLAFVLHAVAPALMAQQVVTFPPAESKPPPPVKSPPKEMSGAEETDIADGIGPSQNKSQMRSPPPPTNLTVMYKVEYGGKLQYTHPDGTVQVFDQWKSFPNDGERLIGFANRELNDGNNYQYATRALSAPGFDPVDIPILYLAGDYDFVLQPPEVENLRRFLLGGGTLLCNAARGRDEFSRAVAREMRKVFPQKPLMRLPPDHPIFHSRSRIDKVTVIVNGTQSIQPPEAYSIDIGTRAAVVLVPLGLGAAWSDTPYHTAGRHIMGLSAKRLGVNLIAYMLGCTEYGRFLAQEFPQYEGRTGPGDVFRFATVRYAGSWDLNPALQNSIIQGLKDNTRIEGDLAPHVVAFDDVDIGRYPLVFMTGHYEFQFTKEEAAGLARYLQRGGMVFVTAGAGLKPFDRAFRRELKKALPDGQLLKLPPTHPLFVGGWAPLEKAQYTPAALKDDPTLEAPEFHGLFIDGRLAVLYSPYDLMSGLNREANAYAKGIAADDALRLTIDTITYALSH